MADKTFNLLQLFGLDSGPVLPVDVLGLTTDPQAEDDAKRLTDAITGQSSLPSFNGPFFGDSFRSALREASRGPAFPLGSRLAGGLFARIDEEVIYPGRLSVAPAFSLIYEPSNEPLDIDTSVDPGEFHTLFEVGEPGFYEGSFKDIGRTERRTQELMDQQEGLPAGDELLKGSTAS